MDYTGLFPALWLVNWFIGYFKKKTLEGDDRDYQWRYLKSAREPCKHLYISHRNNNSAGHPAAAVPAQSNPLPPALEEPHWGFSCSVGCTQRFWKPRDRRSQGCTWATRLAESDSPHRLLCPAAPRASHAHPTERSQLTRGGLGPWWQSCASFARCWWDGCTTSGCLPKPQHKLHHIKKSHVVSIY